MRDQEEQTSKRPSERRSTLLKKLSSYLETRREGKFCLLARNHSVSIVCTGEVELD
jgi:hypothetical protein